MEVAVAIGTDPALTYAATAPLPGPIDEMLFAGFLRGEAVDLVQCRTVDLQVPAHAEFVLEGYVDLDETRIEGPFGDHTGYYSLADQYPVLHLTAITHRRDPIYSTTIVGQAPMEDAYLGKATERLFLPLLRLTLPELVDLDLPKEGGFHNCAMVSMRQALSAARAQGHARALGHGADAVLPSASWWSTTTWTCTTTPRWPGGCSTTSTGSGTCWSTRAAGRARPLVAAAAVGRQDRHRRHQEGPRRGPHPRVAPRRGDVGRR